MLPAASAIPVDQAFSLPKAGDLQRSGAVATMVAAAGLRGDCYTDATFHRRWAQRAAEGGEEEGQASTAVAAGSDSD